MKVNETVLIAIPAFTIFSFFTVMTFGSILITSDLYINDVDNSNCNENINDLHK